MEQRSNSTSFFFANKRVERWVVFCTLTSRLSFSSTLWLVTRTTTGGHQRQVRGETIRTTVREEGGIVPSCRAATARPDPSPAPADILRSLLHNAPAWAPTLNESKARLC